MRKWLTIAEAADYFGYKRKTFYSYVARGYFPKEAILHIGHSIRVNPGIIEAKARRQK